MIRIFLKNNKPIIYIDGSSGNTATPPIFTVAPAITGTAVVGQTLTCDGGTVTGTEPITRSYQWLRGTTPIGTNSVSYTPVQADAGNTSNIKCVVTATNSAGSASADSNTVAQVLDADLNATLLRGTTLGYTIPNVTGIAKLNTLLIGVKHSGAWAKLDVFYCFAMDGADRNFATLNYKAPTLYQNTLVNSPTFTNKQGFTWAATAQIVLNYNPATNGVNFTQNNASVMIWTFSGNNIIGAASDGGAIRINQSTGALRINDGTGGVISISGNGIRGVARSNASFRKSYINGVVGSDIAAASIAITSQSLVLFNSNGVLGGGTCSFVFAGASIDAELSAFNAALSNYISSL
jgi:hypothetical protein